MKKLYIIEGFDRSGKDTLMNDLSKENLSNTYIYFNNLEGLPKYDKEQDDFLVWLNKFIDKQTNDLVELFKKYDNIVMTRLIISDEVYSSLFNREHTTIKYMDRLNDIEIYNYCILFLNYNEYLNRIKHLENEEVQYLQRDFERINDLYEEKLISSNYKYYINYIKSDTTPNDILQDFISYIKN